MALSANAAHPLWGYLRLILAILLIVTPFVFAASVRSPRSPAAIDWDSATYDDLRTYEAQNMARFHQQKQDFLAKHKKRNDDNEARWNDGTCDASEFVVTQAPKQNPFLPLTEEEVADVEKWFYGNKEYNLTTYDKAHINDNTLWQIELLNPNKTDVLNYFGGDGKLEKYARVVLYNGGLASPNVQELMVGPLPVSAQTVATPLEYIYQNATNGLIPFHARYTGSLEFAAITELILSFTVPLKDVMQDLFGGVLLGNANDTLTYSWQGPNSLDGNWRRYWLFFLAAGPGASYIVNVGLFVYIDVSGTDTNLYHVRKIVYNDQIFATVDEFMTAHQNGTIKKAPVPNVTNTTFATRDREGPARPLENRAAPINVAFDGPRYSVDEKENYVSWLDWEIYMGFNRDTGLTLWNVQFKGERIFYEVSLQEAIAQYSGYDPVQASTAYLDRHYGIGGEVHRAILGYDCPYDATTLNASYHQESTYYVQGGSICVFEQDLGFPQSRHYDEVYLIAGSTKGSALVLRTFAAVYNYDYMFDYIFYLDGTMEIRIAASGYLQATYWNHLQDNYGTRVSATNMGSIHSHVHNFKVDIDVGGIANTLQLNNLTQETITPPWFDEEDGPTVQLHVDRVYIEDESQSAVQFMENGLNLYMITNQDSLNPWGYPRGYRIQPGVHAAWDPVTTSRRMLNNAQWAKYSFAVTKQKDTEPFSSTTWNGQLPVTPPVAFDNFFSPPESLNQTDVVVWVNLGMQHLPRAEDVPNTLIPTSRSSIIFSPFNYKGDEQSRDIQNAIIVQQKDEGKSWGVVRAGIEPKACSPPPLAAFSYYSDFDYAYTK